MVTLKDIAAKVGVSISVVSRVLRNNMGQTRVRPEVAEAIRRAAKEMGYVPNPSAVALVRRQHNTLGLFFHRIGVPGSGIQENTLDGICAAARERHQRLLVVFFSTTEEFRQEWDAVRHGYVDGVLFVGRPHQDLLPDVVALRKTGRAVVTLYHEPLAPDIPNVGIDQQMVGYLATRHLLDLGCHRVVFLSTQKDASSSDFLRRRKEGWLRAMAEAYGGAPPSDLLEIPCGLDYASGARAIGRLMEGNVWFDGVVAASDAQASAVLNEVERRGRRVPEEVRIIGVDDSPICQMTHVPLSSISQQYFERAQRAVALLCDAIHGQEVHSEVFPPVLRPRTSTLGT